MIIQYLVILLIKLMYIVFKENKKSKYTKEK